MESLENFNNRRIQEYAFSSTRRQNGIACPKCGSEMFDSNTTITLTSIPPKKEVGCQCGYHGYRIA